MRLILAENVSQADLFTQLDQRRSKSPRIALEYGLALANAKLAWLNSTLDRFAKQPQAMEVEQGD